jgi:superfamily II DNA or RNA helicase
MTLTLRPYQQEALDSIKSFYDRGIKKQLLVLATGGGKTFCFSSIPSVIEDSLPMLVLAHREELLDQAKRSLEIAHPEFKIQIEQASRKVDTDCDVVVASVPTLGRKDSERIKKFQPNHFKTIIVDESHHASASTYRNILDYFQDYFLLGVTATPQRSDNVRLTDVFDEIVYYKTMPELIKEGWLSPVVGYRVKTSVDISSVQTNRGDYVESQLQAAVDIPARNDAIVDAYNDIVPHSKAIVFCAGVDHAYNVASSFKKSGISVATIVGETSSEQRHEIFAKFRTGEIKVITNANVLCLDTETEILTDQGWTKYNEMTYRHKVANWDDGNVHFVEPQEIVVRDRLSWENMYVLETRTRSIRVTGGHRMLYRTSTHSQWLKTAVENIADKSVQLPVCGNASPFTIEVPSEFPSFSSKKLKSLISSTAYNLRNRENYTWETSFKEASNRINSRYSLAYKNPSDLTLDECRFIGFWIGDGSVNDKLIRGGREYILSQSTSYPNIVNWIDSLLSRLGIDYIRRDKTTFKIPHIRWSIPRGTGRGSQKRKGIYHLEPYLNKSGTNLFWGFNRDQILALIEGFWYADGNHGQAISTPDSYLIHNTNKDLLDLLQSILVVRNLNASVLPGRFPVSPTHKQIYTLTVYDRQVHHMGSKPFHLIQKENLTWFPEKVWCVKTDTKNIITRRNGRVTVMGNTEGFDEPSVETIILARPTRSNLLYTQIVGRGTRLFEGKSKCTIIDIADTTRGKKPLGLPSLLGLPPDFDLQGKDLLDAADKYNDLLSQSPGKALQCLSVDDIELSYQQINLFMPPPPNEFVQKYSCLVWAEIAENEFHISMNENDSLRIYIDAIGRWTVDHYRRSSTGSKATTLGHPKDMKECFTRSDKWIMKNYNTTLIDANAAWRADAPTDKQVKILKKIGIQITPNMTKGLASQIISKYFESNPRPNWLKNKISSKNKW